ncbi:MAG: GDP-mannose 4,6-dehydratase [Candidatus Bathyarchaeota archaeon]|jgi:GDPmannose 4,6-dehydratase|nr:GDP-mannose 4,6-dehydratase [Candidatus Bathyarchaeota archaeon]
MKALIFGITGQDGSYLAELLLSKGYSVTGVTRRSSTSNTENINHILQKIKLIEGDITDAFSVNSIINEEEPDEVYNLAAQSHVGTSFNQPNYTWDVTAGGTLNILESIRFSARKDDIRFYQASSSEMFGKNFTSRLKKGFIQDDCVYKYQDENTPFVPQSPYAIAKLASHHLVRNYRDSYNIHGSCGILFNHESERRGENFVTRKITKWIGEFVQWIDETGYTMQELESDDFKISEDHITNLDGSFPKLRLGNLDAYRDWGHAEDYVNAMWLMLQQEDADDYVVATGETHSVREFLDAAFARVDIDDWSNFVVVDPKFYRPAEVDYLLGFPEKAERCLGWKRKISFKDLANRMVDKDVKTQGLRRPSLQTIQTCCSEKG